MVLVIDVGNTNIVIALMKESEALYVKRYETGKRKHPSYHLDTLSKFLDNTDNIMNGKLYSAIEGTIISSVVPEVNDALEAAVEKCLGVKPMFVSYKLNTGLDIKYVDPSKLGADLICGAVGAVSKYGCPLILIDIGTATTFSVISEKSEYLGGIIAPGPYTGLRALTSVASLLPSGELPMIDGVIGTTTRDCMSIGTFTAHAAMIDGMIDRISEEMNVPGIKVIATGGPARDITRMCRHEIVCDRDLVLTGIYNIFYKN